MIAERLSCVSVSPYRRLSQTNCSLLSRSRERSQFFYAFALQSMRHLLEALYYGLNKSAPTLAIDSG
jgi:hypothetical protein